MAGDTGGEYVLNSRNMDTFVVRKGCVVKYLDFRQAMF